MYIVMGNIKIGDSFDDVARYFKSAKEIEAADPMIQKVWQSRPWPIQDEDRFWHFEDSSGRHGAVFQFRQGYVVNHQASDFADPDRLANMNHFPSPPILFRYGFWPLFTVAVGISAAVLFLIDRTGKRRNPKPTIFAPSKPGEPA
jgi:hypothetical protein